VIAIEYISHAFEKKHRESKSILLFVGGCLAYFLVVTVLNQAYRYEGLLGLGYGVVLKFSLGRFVIALPGRKRSRQTRMEDCMMGGVCLLIFFLVIGLLSLESGVMPQTRKYYLSLWLLCGMFGLVVAVGLFSSSFLFSQVLCQYAGISKKIV